MRAWISASKSTDRKQRLELQLDLYRRKLLLSKDRQQVGPCSRWREIFKSRHVSSPRQDNGIHDIERVITATCEGVAFQRSRDEMTGADGAKSPQTT